MFEWFASLTGSWGAALLDWYLANSWINLPILGYGLLVLLAWRNYDLVEGRIYDDLLERTEFKKGKPHFPAQPGLSWQQAIAGLSYPWIARRGHLLLKRLDAGQAEALIDMRALRVRAELRFKHQKEQQKRK